MRKATICFVLFLCSVLASGQDEPQWKVVKHITLMQQSQPILQVGLFTPAEIALHRVTFYFSVGNGRPGGTWTALLAGTDVSGGLGFGDSISCEHPRLFSYSTMAILKPDAPLTYEVDGVSGVTHGCQYNLVITVEQLEQ